MSQNSKIEWTDHTFNAWRGCTKVSEGCANCYAAVNMSVNLHGIKWGPRGERVAKAESGWREPIKWNANARTAGRRARVFCASLADVFEAADTMPAESWPVVQAARLRLLRLIYDTPHLDWLLLTKRPENIRPALGQAQGSLFFKKCEEGSPDDLFNTWLWDWIYKTPPANVWLGTSVENQEQADARIPHLLAAPAAVRFLSCEPLLGPVDLLNVKHGEHYLDVLNKEYGTKAADSDNIGFVGRGGAPGKTPFCFGLSSYGGINWVIVGGESGPKSRPMHIGWAHHLKLQCQGARVPFLFKQWGEYRCFHPHEAKPNGIGAKGRTDWHNWPGGCVSVKLGKHEAGRLLDGQEYNEFPSSPAL